MFELAYNSSRHSTTCMAAPFQLLYGEIPHTPASLVHGPPKRSPDATAFDEGLMSSQLAASDTIQQANHLFRDRHAQTRRGHVYLPGEEVLLSSVVRAFVFARRASKVLPKVCRSIYHPGIAWNQYSGAANSPANPVQPHQYCCQCRSPAALQAATVSTWFI
jgi:hypothetical protein